MRKICSKTKPVLNIGINRIGVDYIVGDIHGKYTLLLDKLSSINFDFSKDRLFSVGDIVNRGPDSQKCLSLLNKPWFFAVRGNHDQAAIDYYNGFMPAWVYEQWGGKWFIDLDKDTQQSIASILDDLPWVIQLMTANGVVGIVHSQPAKIDGEYNWARFVNGVRLNAYLHNWDRVREVCTWDRSIVENEKELKKNIPGVLAVVGGHTPVPEALKQYNFYCIDTGACYNDGYFTLLQADTLEFI